MINKDKSASEALDQLSKVYLSENRLSDARQTYLRILKLDPLNAKARIALAEVEKKLGNTMGSKLVLREVVRDLPNSPWAETATAMLNFR
jgi:tetratricopeptide (TPR) repeat protein